MLEKYFKMTDTERLTEWDRLCNERIIAERAGDSDTVETLSYYIGALAQLIWG